jgi:hypothetical protein
MMIEHAQSRGVEVVHGLEVSAPIQDSGGRVAGVRFRAGGRRRAQGEVRARYVVDASGPAAVLARKLCRRDYDDKMRQVAFYTYFKNVKGPEGVRAGHVLIATNPWGWFWYIPMDGRELGQASVGLVSGQEFKEEYGRLGVEAFFQRALEQTPFTKDLLGPRAERIADYQAITDWAYTCDRMAGPGFYLAGDAAAFLDPLLSTGCTMAVLAGYSASVCINTVLRDPSREEAALSFYNGNYSRMWTVTRDFLHYFYAGAGRARPDDFFWKARSVLQFGDSVAANQAFCFLVNTIPANPHPALRKQIHMYLQFMANIQHPVEKMKEDKHFQHRMEESLAWVGFDRLDDRVVPVPNGSLEQTWTIDQKSHQLVPVRGITYDQMRPVFSSTSSWLLGRNIQPLDDEAWRLVEAMDGQRAWGEVVRQTTGAAAPGDEARAAVTATLQKLCAENLVLLREPETAA